MVDYRFVEVDGQNEKETDSAVKLFNGDKKAWIAKSLMEEWPGEGEFGSFIIQEWVAIDNELI